MKKTIVLLAMTILLAVPAWVQGQEPASRDTGSSQVAQKVAQVSEILRIIGLPGITEEARREGLPEEDIQIIIEESRRRKLPPSETIAIMEESGHAARENGPVDNFGAFVQSRLDSGLRGRELSDAIHAEHRLHGKGHAHNGKPEKDHGKDSDRDDADKPGKDKRDDHRKDNKEDHK